MIRVEYEKGSKCVFFFFLVGCIQVFTVLFFVPFCIGYLLLHNKSPRTLWLKQHAFMIPQYLWVRNPGVA